MSESPDRILQCDKVSCREERNTLYQVGDNGAMLCGNCVPPEMKSDLLALMRYAYTGRERIRAARIRAARIVERQRTKTGRGDHPATTSTLMS